MLCTIDHAKVITSISFRNGHKAPPKSLGHLRLRELRRQPFNLLSFSSSKKARKAQETQSYQRIQCIGHTDFKALSQTLLQTPLPCFHASINEYYTAKNGLGTIAPRLLSQVKAGTHSPLLKGSHTAAHTTKHGAFQMGVVSLPSEHSARSRTSPGRVSERQTLPLLGLGRRRS